MKNIKRGLGVITCLLVCFLMSFGTFVNAYYIAPQKIVYDTEKTIIGKEYIQDFVVETRKIVSKQGVGYCLEIDKDYPTGQEFSYIEDCSLDIKKILLSGYPHKTAADLGLKSDDDAYFATQIAIWSQIEGYNINKIKSQSPEVDKAIIAIYNNAKAMELDDANYRAVKYYAEDKTQKIGSLMSLNQFNALNDNMDNNSGNNMANGMGNDNNITTLPQTGQFDFLVPVSVGIFAIFVGGYLFKLSKDK